jgi:hypothetical protein
MCLRQLIYEVRALQVQLAANMLMATLHAQPPCSKHRCCDPLDKHGSELIDLLFINPEHAPTISLLTFSSVLPRKESSVAKIRILA